MKISKLALCFLAFAVLTVAACAPRPLSPGFDKFLKEHPTTLPKVEQKAGYSIDQASMDMKYVFKSFTAGGGMIMPGQMLQDYLNTTAPQAFDSLKADSQGKEPLVLKFHINNYTFQHFKAHMDLHVEAYKNGSKLFEKDYQADGEKQAGKMFWGGAWAQRHAVHSSTESALNKIMKALIGDLK